MQAATPLRLDLLGHFSLHAENREIRLSSGKAMLLLAFLAVADRQTARRDRLAALLWQDSNAEQARGSLRQTLSRLRAVLGTARDAVHADNELIALSPACWQIDVDELARCDGLDPAAVRIDWAGSFLAGVHQRDAAIDAWLEGERQRCLQLSTRVFSTAVECALGNGDPARALALGMRLTSLDPYAEPVHRQLMRAHESNGDRAAALRQYRTLVRVLEEGLGVSPDDESRALYEQLRRPSPAALPAVRDGVGPIEAAGARRRTVTVDVGLAVPAQALRLVTVLALQAYGGEHTRSSRSTLDDIVGAEGGEPILSHGLEALFVFGLDERADSDAVLRVVRQLEHARGGGSRPTCGCASGLVSLDRQGYPVGAVVQRAARLALLADDGDFVIDRAVASQVSARLHHEEIRLRDLVGYRVVHMESCVPDTSVELVGRQAEQTQLGYLLDEIEAGPAAIALIAGDAGMGKSWLVLDTIRHACARDYAIVELDFTRHEASRAGTMARLTRAVRDRLLDRRLDADLDERQQLTLQRMLDTTGAGPRRTLRDDEREERVQLLVHLFSILTGDVPVLFVVEDCHWAPPTAIAGLVDLIDRLDTHPLLMLATERREHDALGERLQQQLIRVPVFHQILTPLPRRDAEALLRRYPMEDDAQERILDRAGGHPLFLAQLAESGLDVSEPVPMSVVAMVQSELDRLPANARDACLKAAVLGPEPILESLEAVFPEVERSELEGGRLVHRRGERLVFRHALVHEAIHALLDEPERRQLHGRAARYFRDRNPGDYAYHALRSGERDLAVDAVIAAAEWLLDDNRIDETAEWVDEAMSLQPDGDQRGALLLCRAQVLRERGDLKGAIAACRHAYDGANDAELRVRALIRSAQLLKRRGQHERAGVQLRDARRVAESQDLPSALLAELEHECGNHMFMRGEAERCLAHHRRARSLAEAEGHTRLQALALGGLGDAHYAAGRAHRANRYFSECVALADEAQYRSIAVAHRGMEVFTAHLILPGDEPIARMREVVAEAHRWRSLHHELLGRVLVADMLAHAGDVEASEREARDTAGIQARFGGVRFAPDLHFVLTLCRWIAGDRNGARRLAGEGVERFGEDYYMGATFQAVFAAVCYDDRRAEDALLAGERLMREGALVHNRIDFAWFASACHWQRGDRERARDTVVRADAGCGGEPVRHLRACLAWMDAPASALGEVRRRLSVEALGAMAVTHPRDEQIGARTRVPASTRLPCVSNV